MPPSEAAARKVTVERILRGRIEDVWDLWTTKAGLETWWGPEGFSTEIRRLDLYPGGEFVYKLTAKDLVLRKGMETVGLPVSSVVHARYLEVNPRTRLAYATLVDFVPDARAYETKTVVEFHTGGGEVRIRLVTDVMHNEEWTNRAVMGYKSQFDRLEKLLASGTAGKGGP